MPLYTDHHEFIQILMHLAMYCMLIWSMQKLQQFQHLGLNRTQLICVTDALGGAAHVGGVWEVGEEWYSS